MAAEEARRPGVVVELKTNTKQDQRWLWGIAIGVVQLLPERREDAVAVLWHAFELVKNAPGA